MKVKLGSHSFDLPRSRALRLVIGTALVAGGVLGLLPVLGFWMLPLGLIVLAIDLPPVRRFNRTIMDFWARVRLCRRPNE